VLKWVHSVFHISGEITMKKILCVLILVTRVVAVSFGQYSGTYSIGLNGLES